MAAKARVGKNGNGWLKAALKAVWKRIIQVWVRKGVRIEGKWLKRNQDGEDDVKMIPSSAMPKHGICLAFGDVLIPLFMGKPLLLMGKVRLIRLHRTRCTPLHV